MESPPLELYAVEEQYRRIVEEVAAQLFYWTTPKKNGVFQCKDCFFYWSTPKSNGIIQ
jgi:hypothetical protein